MRIRKLRVFFLSENRRPNLKAGRRAKIVWLSQDLRLQ